AQALVPASVDELEELHRELHVADPPTPPLDLHRLLASRPHILLDTDLGPPDLVDGTGRELLRVHERGDLSDEPIADLEIARDRASLDQGLSLPRGGVLVV